MPSLAVPLWLIFAATSQPDPLSPPPHGREPEKPAQPAKPTTPAAKAPPSVARPAEPKAPKPPTAPDSVKATTPTSPAARPAKLPSKTKEPPPIGEEPVEEMVADLTSTSKPRKKASRKVAPPAERGEVVPERRNAWSADRYAAVVPPGLTLAALRNQISKASSAGAEAPLSPEDHSHQSTGASDIDKAREALRQETARLEALLKAAGNCGGASSGMPLGDPMQPSSSIPAATLREAAGEQIDSVSKAMKGMKPEQAAALIARLDRGLAAEILRRMKSTDAGAVLGLLKPELAAELATEIATRKPIYPKDKKGAAK
ncbi:MAG TPA: hypothetical protein VIM14_03335 [Polyangia bacterium]